MDAWIDLFEAYPIPSTMVIIGIIAGAVMVISLYRNGDDDQ